MDREYVGRGQRLEVQELPDVNAVKPSEGQQTENDIERSGGRARPPATTPLVDDLPDFERDGWVFVSPNAAVRDAVRERRPAAGTDAALRVFVDPTGQVLLGLDRLTVRLDDDMDAAQAREVLVGAGLEILHQLNFAKYLFMVRVPPDRDFLEVARELSKRPEFIYAEPQFIEQIPARFQPGDPDFGQQWHLKNTGQLGGSAGADIEAEAAWDLSRGAGIKIAIVDHGFELVHPELDPAVDRNLSAYFRTAPNPQDRALLRRDLSDMPNEPHGTFCAGIALARADNNFGGCGVANLAQLIAVACLRDSSSTQETLADAISYAADPDPANNPGQGADVISCSLGRSSGRWTMQPVLQDAIDWAVTHGRGGLGTPVFWAVQNVAAPISDDQVSSYAHTIAVGCSTRRDVVGTCAFGPELDFLATGVEVYSAHPPSTFDTLSGTSWAAPAAAGVAALLLAVDSSLTWQRVRQIMRDSCTRIGGSAVNYASGRNDHYGFGRVNAKKALAML